MNYFNLGKMRLEKEEVTKDTRLLVLPQRHFSGIEYLLNVHSQGATASTYYSADVADGYPLSGLHSSSLSAHQQSS
jgi:hypothetical protein